MTAGALSPLRDKDCFRFPLQPPQDPAFHSSYWMHAGCSAFGPFAVSYRRFQMVSRNAVTG
jgi:hypothetical protein